MDANDTDTAGEDQENSHDPGATWPGGDAGETPPDDGEDVGFPTVYEEDFLVPGNGPAPADEPPKRGDRSLGARTKAGRHAAARREQQRRQQAAKIDAGGDGALPPAVDPDPFPDHAPSEGAKPVEAPLRPAARRTPATSASPPPEFDVAAASPFACVLLAHPVLAEKVLDITGPLGAFGCSQGPSAGRRPLDDHRVAYEVLAAFQKLKSAREPLSGRRIDFDPGTAPEAVREALQSGATLYGDPNILAQLKRPGVLEALQARGAAYGADEAVAIVRRQLKARVDEEEAQNWNDDPLDQKHIRYLERQIAAIDLSLPTRPGDMPFQSCRELEAENPRRSPSLIEGLVRVGEICNLIAESKVGKSGLALQAALSVASGLPFLGRHATLQGAVLLIDNELHRGTINYRIGKTRQAMGISPDNYQDDVKVWSCQGKAQDIDALQPVFDRIEPGDFKLVIVDAFYRFLPLDADENDNRAIAAVYSRIQQMAARIGCAVLLVHHTSKGNQSGKSVTDTGAGAGSASRAADNHIVLRRHRQDGVFVLEGSVRDFAALKPACYRYSFPIWGPAEPDLDPHDLLRANGRQRASLAAKPEKPKKVEWTAAMVVEQFVTTNPVPKNEIIARAVHRGVPRRRVGDLLALAASENLIVSTVKPPKQTVCIAARS